MTSNMFNLPELVDYNSKGKWPNVFSGEDKFNTTCPPDLSDGFQKNFLSQTFSFGNVFNSVMNSTIQEEYGQHNACSMEDEVREALMRKRRKEDSYKTALCDSYRRTNACLYGDGCHFAHGLTELRLPSQPRGRAHPKYKTVLCDKFSATGYCKYGSRCQFIHKITNPTLLKKQADIRKELQEEDNPLVHFFQQRTRDDFNQSLPLVSNHHERVDRPCTGALDRNEREVTSTHLELKDLPMWNRSSFGQL